MGKDKPADFRKQAEERLEKRFQQLDVLYNGDPQRLSHELHVHQVELEMQNEELRKSHAELEESRARYSDLYDFAPVGYFTFDKNGLIIEVNLAGAAQLGVDRSLLIKKTFSGFIQKEDQDVFFLHRGKVFETKTLQTCELRLKRKNGAEFYAQLQSLAVEKNADNAVYCMTAVSDISERKRAEQALLEINETLAQHVAERITELQAANALLRDARLAALNLIEDAFAARKAAEKANLELQGEIAERRKAEMDVLRLSEDMAARNLELESLNKELEAFIYSVSHDLRAPLRHMSSFAKFLIDDYSERLDDQGRDYLKRINRGSEKMTQLIEDLLYLSKISRQAIKRTNIDMSKLVSSIVADLRDAGPFRSVEVNVAEGLTAYADQRLIQIALSNLLGNAWKFTSKIDNARIEFGVMSESIGQIGHIGPIFYVRDNGAGFNSEYMEKMFRPFQRLHSDKEFEGTGIGLAIVESVIRRHGGKIWAEGEIGKGATIYFTLE